LGNRFGFLGTRTAGWNGELADEIVLPRSMPCARGAEEIAILLRIKVEAADADPA